MAHRNTWRRKRLGRNARPLMQITSRGSVVLCPEGRMLECWQTLADKVIRYEENTVKFTPWLLCPGKSERRTEVTKRNAINPPRQCRRRSLIFIGEGQLQKNYSIIFSKQENRQATRVDDLHFDGVGHGSSSGPRNACLVFTSNGSRTRTGRARWPILSWYYASCWTVERKCPVAAARAWINSTMNEYI